MFDAGYGYPALLSIAFIRYIEKRHCFGSRSKEPRYSGLRPEADIRILFPGRQKGGCHSRARRVSLSEHMSW
jgi:hypothetical protein